MSFFNRLFGRSPEATATSSVEPSSDPFAGHGFIYYDTTTSPNGTIQVLNGHSGGEKGPVVIETKVVIAATGRVLFDLWNTYQHCRIAFAENDTAELSVTNAHDGRKRSATINFNDETFILSDGPAVSYPLTTLRKLISTF